MTTPGSNIPDTVRQAEGGRHEEGTGVESAYSTTERNNNTRTAEWINLQPSLATTNANTANFGRVLNHKGNTGSEEYNGQTKFFDMQNNSYLKAGYPDTRAYYGWLPAGFSPMRLPALISPYSFLGFAPTVAWMKTNDNDNTQGQVANIEKIDRWEGKHKDGASSTHSEVSQAGQHSTAYADKIMYSTEKAKDKTESFNSDDDEGLVLDERETFRRRRHVEKLQTQTMKSQPERSSVIQENISIQAKPSVITHAQDATSSEHDHNKPAKRGRASTRQIEKTDQYWDRRKKNNVSAKKSRDARRQRESLMNQRSSMLETENLRLRAELATLRDENIRLKQELSNLKNTQP